MTPDIPPLPPGFDIEKEFPIAGRWLFLNHAGVAPMAARARAAMETYAREATDDAYLTGRWYKKAETVRNAAARMINADPSEIAFTKNTSEGIAFVANGLTWKPGQQILSTSAEYPANAYPWMDLAARFGVEHVMVPQRDGRIDAAELIAGITPRTRMVAISHVEFASGYRNDMAAIGQACRDRGVLLCADAIQSVGVLPVDVKAMNIDFLSADGHKWMCGPEGAGIFYCRRELIPHLHPEIGWMNMKRALEYSVYDFTLRDDAKRFECGSYNLAGILALGGALELLLEVGIDLIARRVLALTDYLAELLAARGCQIFSPRASENEKSGILSFSSPRGDHDRIVHELRDQKVILVVREGRLRASPHFYNTAAQMEALARALPEA